MFKRAPSMDQAAIDALIEVDIGKSKAIREFLGARRAQQRRANYHVQLRNDPFALPELPELDIPGLNPGHYAQSNPGRDERRRLVAGARFEWFGPPWDSPICHAGPRQRQLPRGLCFGCETPFFEGDQGLALVQTEPEVTTFFHRVCFPVWLKTRLLSLDLGEVLMAIAEQRIVRASDRAGSDRAASVARVAEVEAANTPGDAWENPSWEEP